MKVTRVLVVDDEPEILVLIKGCLNKEGYTVFTARNASSAVKLAKERKPDIIILDLGLPGISGWEVCRMLKQMKETEEIPIIIMTAKYVSTDDVVKGLNEGADDYITKPFKLSVLSARVNAILRRKLSTEKVSSILSDGKISVNLDEHQAYTGKEKLLLTPKEFDLLVLLLEKRGKVLSRSHIMENVWGYEYYGTTRTIDKHIENLRKKLGKEGRRIETLEGIGYRYFLEDVTKKK